MKNDINFLIMNFYQFFNIGVQKSAILRKIG
uniref:Uncharacterized protein n=1 Tax=Siphoviridae sp. ctWWc42 TaxID=2826361 RepID=A0A8S5R298_9CAUD|nr:MAG TPA: hypothetical protein [Siphoviridae sp. ctWWc42]